MNPEGLHVGTIVQMILVTSGPGYLVSAHSGVLQIGWFFILGKISPCPIFMLTVKVTGPTIIISCLGGGMGRGYEDPRLLDD